MTGRSTHPTAESATSEAAPASIHRGCGLAITHRRGASRLPWRSALAVRLIRSREISCDGMHTSSGPSSYCSSPRVRMMTLLGGTTGPNQAKFSGYRCTRRSSLLPTLALCRARRRRKIASPCGSAPPMRAMRRYGEVRRGTSEARAG